MTLLPGSGKGVISCTLNRVACNDLPSTAYAALSWAWGDPNITRTILVGGHDKEVPINLKAALWHLRHAYEPLLLWVDALCINQADAEERGHQVQIMGDIYRGADRVLVRLGLSDQYSNTTFDLIQDCRSIPMEEAHKYCLAVSSIYRELDLSVDMYDMKLASLLYQTENCGIRLDLMARVNRRMISRILNINLAEIVALQCTFMRRNWWYRQWVV